MQQASRLAEAVRERVRFKRLDGRKWEIGLG
jgi:hypothetical protein